MRIAALGGWAERPLQDHILGLTGRERPRLLYVPTAGREEPEWTLSIYTLFRDRADVSHVNFFRWPPEDLRERTPASDVIWIAGGNTANMLASGASTASTGCSREAWENDVLLTGWSAGAICWFDAGVTDSFGPQLEGMRDGSASFPAARVRTTTARNCAARGTPSSCATVSGRGSRSTTTSRSASTAPSSPTS